MPGFKASKGRLALLLGAKAAGDCKVEASVHLPFHTHTQIVRPLRIMLNLLCLCLKWTKQAWGTAHLSTTQFIDYFKPSIETYCSGEQQQQQNTVLLIMQLVTQEL